MAIRKKFSTIFVTIGALSRTICSLIISDKNTNGIPFISRLLPGRIFSIIYFVICPNCIASYKYFPFTFLVSKPLYTSYHKDTLTNNFCIN